MTLLIFVPVINLINRNYETPHDFFSTNKNECNLIHVGSIRHLKIKTYTDEA